MEKKRMGMAERMIRTDQNPVLFSVLRVRLCVCACVHEREREGACLNIIVGYFFEKKEFK